MNDGNIYVVTGAFGFTGSHIARRLLSEGKAVRTLTSHPRRDHELSGKLEVAPLNFDRPDELTGSLRGADTVFNTYWIRFSHGSTTFDKAVQNTLILINAARDAGVRKFVHVSITNPSLDSPLPYFRGKAVIEDAIKESGLSYTILRPAVIFGEQGILINNIAWFLRRFPIFAVPGDGRYQIQPVFVEDLARLAVDLAEKETSTTVDAVGPEIYTFNDMVRTIADAIGAKARLVHLPAQLTLLATKLLGYLVGDVVLTPDEVKGLLANLLVSDQPPTGDTRLSDWLIQNANWLGKGYMSELKKHYR